MRQADESQVDESQAEGKAGVAESPFAVLLMAYGGPDSLEDVEPYLLDVRGGRPTSPELVEEIRHRYAAIGGRSPLLEITRAQARALEGRLSADGGEHRVYVGMRHWQPRIAEAVEQIERDGVRRVVALAMAPHFSRMSIGAYQAKVREAVGALGKPLAVAYVDSWHDDPWLIRALARRVAEALERFPSEDRDRVQVVFSAHSLPTRVVAEGDPYDSQLRETARLVAEALGLPADRWQFCYQSAGASSVPWLGPPIEEVVVELARSGKREILVAPVGFVSDHVEILYDLDVEAKGLAAEHGAHLERTESLNTSPAFVEALAVVVRGAAAREGWR